MSAAPAVSSAWTPAQADAHLRSLELYGMHFGLERMQALMAALEHPQARFGSVHVVGTNGKSSTTRMLAAILEAQGLRAGAYLSPHLVSFGERVRAGARQVTPAAFAAAVERVARAAQDVDRRLVGGEHITQFEALTAAAYVALASDGVDVAVVEAGLGGRLDATNVIASSVQVLTGVGLEHTRFLGQSIAEIAAEKVAVVQPGATLVVGPDLHPDALAVAERIAGERAARVVAAPVDPVIDPVALGAHQRRNFALAATAAEAYLGRAPTPAALRAGAAVEIPGRLQTVAQEPWTLIDGAHNPSGMAALASALVALVGGRRVVGCVSILEDKDADAMLRELVPLCAAVVVCRTQNARSLAPDALAALVRGVAAPGTHVVVEPQPLLAVGRARVLAGREGLVVATGSLALMGELVPLEEEAA